MYKRQEDRIGLANLISSYAENGYQSDLLTYLLTQVDERYRFGHLLEKDLRTQLESGSNSPLLYSAMMLAYREDATLISSLDDVTINEMCIRDRYYSSQPNRRKRAKDSKSQKKSDCHGNSYVFIISGEAGYERGIRKVSQKEPRNSRKNQWHI